MCIVWKIVSSITRLHDDDDDDDVDEIWDVAALIMKIALMRLMCVMQAHFSNISRICDIMFAPTHVVSSHVEHT